MKKLFILLLLILPIFTYTACDDGGTEDVEAKEAGSGSQNLDVSGKTFTSAEEVAMELTKTERVFDADGNVTSTTTTYIPLTKKVYTLVFNTDNTFTLTVDEKFTTEFESKYTYTYKANPVSTTYTTYSGYGSRDNDDTSGSPADGDTLGDNLSYSGYAGLIYSTTVYSGTWSSYDIPTDGLQKITKGYITKVDKKESQTLDTSTGFPAIYAEVWDKSTDTSLTQETNKELVSYFLAGIVDGTTYYEIYLADTEGYIEYQVSE